LVFIYAKYLGFYRHTGFLFLTFLFALWMKKTDGTPRGGSFSIWTDRTAEAVLTVMLMLQAITGFWAIREDFNKPFSCGKMATVFLTDHHLDRAFITVGPDWAGAPLACYLDRSLFYPGINAWGSFTRWDKKRTEDLDDEEFFRRSAAEAKGAPMVIVLGHPLTDGFMKAHGVRFLANLWGSLTPFEDYYLHYVPGTGACQTSGLAPGVSHPIPADAPSP
jgi:hypothetical protein